MGKIGSVLVPSDISHSAGLAMSLAEALKVAVAPDGLVAWRLMFAGSERTGAFVSWTVIVKPAVPVLRCESVAEQFTAFAPSANVEPEAGVQVTATLPSTMSFADWPL